MTGLNFELLFNPSKIYVPDKHWLDQNWFSFYKYLKYLFSKEKEEEWKKELKNHSE